MEERYDWGRIGEEFRELFLRLLETPSRVVIAGEIYPPEIGGLATYTKVVHEAIRSRTAHVGLLTHAEFKIQKSKFKMAPNNPSTSSGYTGQAMQNSKFLRYLRYVFRLLRLSARASLLYAQGPIASGLPSHLVSFLTGKPYLVKITGDYAWEQSRGQGIFEGTLEAFQGARVSGKTRLLKRIERHVVRGASRVIVPSNYLKRIVEGWGVPSERIRVIFNAVEPVEEEGSPVERSPNGKIILSAGRMVPWKGFDVLISLMPELRQEFPDLTLVIAGNGPDEEALKAKSYKLKADQYVRFLGRVPQEELWRRIRASDLFVLYSGYEGLSHQLIEVMQLGTPIIASNAGGNPELIEDGTTGRLVPWGSPEQLKETIGGLLRNPEEGERLAKKAKDFIAQFSEERMIRETFRVLKGVGV